MQLRSPDAATFIRELILKTGAHHHPCWFHFSLLGTERRKAAPKRNHRGKSRQKVTGERICLFVCLLVLFIWLYLFVYLFVCLFNCLSVCLFVCLFVRNRESALSHGLFPLAFSFALRCIDKGKEQFLTA